MLSRIVIGWRNASTFSRLYICKTNCHPIAERRAEDIARSGPLYILTRTKRVFVSKGKARLDDKALLKLNEFSHLFLRWLHG